MVDDAEAAVSLAESAALSAVSLVDSVARSVAASRLGSAAAVCDSTDVLASVSGSADAAIELLPCWASVAPSASDSDWVAASSLANLCWNARLDGGIVILGGFLLDPVYMRLVIERGLMHIEVDGEDESTRIAARRRHNLSERISILYEI